MILSVKNYTVPKNNPYLNNYTVPQQQYRISKITGLLIKICPYTLQRTSYYNGGGKGDNPVVVTSSIFL